MEATAHGTAVMNPLVSLPPKPPPIRFVLQTTRFSGTSKQCAITSCSKKREKNYLTRLLNIFLIIKTPVLKHCSVRQFIIFFF